MLTRMREIGMSLPPDVAIYRTYAGSAQRSCGAWSWHAQSSSNPAFSAGSQWPITALLAAPNLLKDTNKYGQTSIDPIPLPKTKRWNGRITFYYGWDNAQPKQ